VRVLSGYRDAVKLPSDTQAIQIWRVIATLGLNFGLKQIPKIVLEFLSVMVVLWFRGCPVPPNPPNFRGHGRVVRMMLFLVTPFKWPGQKSSEEFLVPRVPVASVMRAEISLFDDE